MTVSISLFVREQVAAHLLNDQSCGIGYGWIAWS
jgi:hypothetical protein